MARDKPKGDAKPTDTKKVYGEEEKSAFRGWLKKPRGRPKGSTKGRKSTSRPDSNSNSQITGKRVRGGSRTKVTKFWMATTTWASELPPSERAASAKEQLPNVARTRKQASLAGTSSLMMKMLSNTKTAIEAKTKISVWKSFRRVFNCTKRKVLMRRIIKKISM